MVDNTSGIPPGQKLSSNIDKNIANQKRFNKELEKTVELANKVLKSMGLPAIAGGGASGAGNIGSTGSFTNNAPGGGSIANFGGFLKKAAAVGLGVASGAAEMMPGLQDVLSTQLLTSQARFSGMSNVGSTVQAAMRGGQSTSTNDMIQAISMGTAGGLMPALPGYGNVLTGVSQVSNLTGSSSSAMQATLGLNQATTVNKLRMFGINVRNAQGGMNDPASIFKQVYNFASQTSGKKLTAQDVAIGSQSGNGLSNFLDFVAGGDQQLRGALQTSAMQFSKGGNLSRASTNATGLTTGAQSAQSDLFSAKFGTEVAAAPGMSKGFIEGAKIIESWNISLSKTLKTSEIANDAVRRLATAETLAADSITRGALSILAVLGASGIGGSILGKTGAAQR